MEYYLRKYMISFLKSNYNNTKTGFFLLINAIKKLH